MNLMNRAKAFHVLFLTAAVVAVFGLGFYVGNSKSSNKIDYVYNKDLGKVSGVDFEPFWKAWSLLDGKFVGSSTPSDEEKLWGAISGLATSYEDPYTSFFPPEEKKEFEEEVSGNFEGVGMEIGVRAGGLVVVAPLKGTPAYRAGILSGDRILKIDGEDASSLSVEQAVRKIRGPRGSEVVISVGREGKDEPIEFKILRDIIDLPTIDTEITKEGVFVIKLYNFSAISVGKFREALREFVESGLSHLVIDLRNNPGGYLEASVDMASWFLPVGKVVVREDYGGNQEEVVHRSRGYNVFSDNLKMVVLVNGGSASASEILSGALKDHGKAKLVGEKTFGKGSVQELVSVTKDTSIKITVARWLTPNGTSLSNGGLVPDIEVKFELEEAKDGKDNQLRKAIEEVLSM